MYLCVSVSESVCVCDVCVCAFVRMCVLSGCGQYGACVRVYTHVCVCVCVCSTWDPPLNLSPLTVVLLLINEQETLASVITSVITADNRVQWVVKRLLKPLRERCKTKTQVEQGGGPRRRWVE